MADRPRPSRIAPTLLLLGTLAAPLAAQQPDVQQPDVHQPGAHQPEALEYRVQPGDSLRSIAAGRLDGPGRWLDVARLNAIDDPRHLRPGTVLRFLPEWLKSDPSQGQVESTGGQARIDGQPAQPGTAVGEGAVIETGGDGIAVIRLADGTVLRIPPASRVRIDRLRSFHADKAIEARMWLERGSIEPVSPPKRLRPLDIRTPAGNAAVRGTDFRVRTAGGVDFVEVLSGRVDAGGGAGRADVDGGLGAAFETARPPELERLLPAPDLRTLAERVYTDVQPLVELPTIARAQAYQIDVARDPSFTRMLVSTRVDTPEIRIATPDDGPLHLRIRGVSALGLNGRDGVTRIDVQARPVPPRPLSPGPADRRTAGPLELRWQDAGHGGAYRVQLADDERFERLLADTVVTGTVARLVLPPGAADRRYWRVAAIASPAGPAGAPRQGPFSAPQSFQQRLPDPVDRIRTVPSLRDGDGHPVGTDRGAIRVVD